MALTYAFYLLATHPEVQEELYTEIQHICGEGELEYSDIPELSYALCIAYETVRLFPFTGSLSQLCQTGQKLVGKYYAPKGVRINLDLVNTQRNKKHWGEDADEFVPSRFRDPDTLKLKTLPRGLFVVFSDGPRACLGNSSTN